MKRNKLMTAAALLLALTMVTTSSFSGVLAKYIVSDGTTDSARVAKFGVTLTAAGDLFGSRYADGGTNIEAWTLATNDSVAASDAATTMLVAPGTANAKGMVFSVKGTPEVKTSLLVDAPEDASHKDYENTDVVLKSGVYSVMARVPSASVVITKNNMGDFYKLSGTTFSVLVENDLANLGTGEGKIEQVYKKTELTTGMSADYYPIQWSLDGVALGTGAQASTANTVAGLLTAIKTDLSGSSSGTATHTSNAEWNETSTVTWAWAYGTAWAESDTEVIPNWENTTANDTKDTILGLMITRAKGTNAASDDYLIAKDATLVQYTTIDAVNGSANQAVLAYTGDAPEAWSDANVACLTASFGARLTVQQLD